MWMRCLKKLRRGIKIYDVLEGAILMVYHKSSNFDLPQDMNRLLGDEADRKRGRGGLG